MACSGGRCLLLVEAWKFRDGNPVRRALVPGEVGFDDVAGVEVSFEVSYGIGAELLAVSAYVDFQGAFRVLGCRYLSWCSSCAADYCSRLVPCCRFSRRGAAVKTDEFQSWSRQVACRRNFVIVSGGESATSGASG